MIDDASDVPRRTHDKTPLATEQVHGIVCALPRNDVILARGVDIGRDVDGGKIQRYAVYDNLAGRGEVVFQIGIAEIPGKERPGKVGAVGIPVEQIKGRGHLTHEVIAADVVPDKLTGPQE